MRSGSAGFLLAALAVPLASRAPAEVAASSEGGFVSRHEVEVGATPAQAWQALVAPAQWWNGEHTYSGSPANLSLDPRAGGCFCETLPATANAPAGGIEHMRVVLAQPGRALRLSGALGPLQSEAVAATLTVTLKPSGTGTRLTWEYVVGGYLRYPTEQIAPLVDQVMGEQFGRLAARLRPVPPAAAGAAAPPGGALAGPPSVAPVTPRKR